MNSNTMIDNFVNMHAIRAMWYRWAWSSCGAAHQSGWLCNYIAKEETHSAAFIWASSTTALNAHKESWFWCACVFKNCTHCRKNFYLNLSVMTYKFLLNWCMHARPKRPARYLKKSHLFATSFTSHPTVRSPPHLCMDRRINLFTNKLIILALSRYCGDWVLFGVSHNIETIAQIRPTYLTSIWCITSGSCPNGNIHFIFSVNINQGKSNSIEVFEIKVITGRSDSFSPRGTWSRRHFSDERLFTLFQLVIEVLLLLSGAFWYRGR